VPVTAHHARDALFRREALVHALRFRCQHCVHVVPDEGRCSLGYPNDMMTTPDLRCMDDAGRWIFCKYFELEGT
jgi:hypothetical protein